jgi:hypothetical protein
MKPLAEEYGAFDEQLFVILRPEKAIHAVSFNPPFQGNWFHVSYNSIFCQLENVILQKL